MQIIDWVIKDWRIQFMGIILNSFIMNEIEFKLQKQEKQNFID